MSVTVTPLGVLGCMCQFNTPKGVSSECSGTLSSNTRKNVNSLHAVMLRDSSVAILNC